MKYIVYILITLSLISCSSSIKTTISSKNEALTIENPVAILDLHHHVPTTAKKLGFSKFGDTGFSTNCSFNTIIIKARKIARKNGANIVKISKKKAPNFMSSCYRMTIDYYYFDGNTAKLPQIQLQLD